MSLADLILLALKTSVLMIVFALGLKSNAADLIHLLRHPWQWARSFLAMSVLVPLLAVILAKAIGVQHALGAALIALSLAPVPPILPGKAMKAGGDSAYAVGLLTTASLVAIIWIPIAIEIIAPRFDARLHVPPLAIAQMVFTTLLLPLAAGVVVHALAPRLAQRVQPPLASVAGAMLLVAALVIVVSKWQVVAAQLGDGTLRAFALFVAGGLAIGHLLGGPGQDNRTVLAMASASRHPGIAITIAMMNFPGEQAILGAVALYLITSMVISLPYVMWRTRLAHHAAPGTESRLAG